MLGESIHSRASRLERARAARYREEAEHIREIANMETSPKARACLLELADQYQRLADDLAGSKAP